MAYEFRWYQNAKTLHLSYLGCAQWETGGRLEFIALF